MVGMKKDHQDHVNLKPFRGRKYQRSLSPSPRFPRVRSSQQLASAPYSCKLNALASWSRHALQLALRYCLDSLLHHIRIACACRQLKWSWGHSTVQQKRSNIRRFSWCSSISYASWPENARKSILTSESPPTSLEILGSTQFLDKAMLSLIMSKTASNRMDFFLALMCYAIDPITQ